MPSLEVLHSYCAVVEEGGFRAAAARRHCSQPAISQQIKALERELGRVLLDRKRRRPTPAGQMLYMRARGILNDADALARELEDFDETAEHELRVGTSDTTALYFLPPFVRQFASAMPNTHLKVVDRPSEAIAEQVVRGDLDLGIVTLPVVHAELEQRELFKERLVLVAPAEHRLGGRRRARLDTVHDEPFVLLEAGTRTGAILRDYFRRESFDPQVVVDSGSFEVIKRYVAEGIGLSFLPEIVITDADNTLTTIHVPGVPKVHIGAIWRRGAYQTRAECAFLDMITKRSGPPTAPHCR
ncbi:MAG TPA: LysR family transcriptional regulator [Candidatus Hydrogenedentes bacterium]|nr:LysR family transcriptional regulator [Candidatus Hydrogenedentota bacterium]HIJ72809.1 LysR family transcriptional regulator [Candidatus Hydrogenedentota bacterium]